ncbi:ATP-dependent Lon protease [Aliivibrio kagoshimensis]|uniref:ATP-dependent Lon protease n=1 Tax=Aliivibrio kagoshimensis TaxID=2910230 RepID=UPI003D12F7EA
MMFSPSSVNVPLIAPSVNLPTEQVARDNRVRQPVTPAKQLTKSLAEKPISEKDKQRRREAWDPSEHPDYVFEEEDGDVEHLPSFYVDNELARIAKLLSLDTYAAGEGMGYTIRFGLPKELLVALEQLGTMVRRRTVISYHYDKSVVPNLPSEVLAVL